MVPPQVRPTANASSSEYPNVITPRSRVPASTSSDAFDHGALDAAARDRARDLAVVVHGHGGAGVAWAEPFERDDARHRDPMAGGPPPFDVVQHFFHR